MFSNIRGYNDIASENKKLTLKVMSLGQETVELLKLREENRELRAMLQFRDLEALDTPVVFADVLTRSIGAQRAQISINIGRRDGVVVGAAVIVEDGVLIGLVETVKESVSVVRLISDHRSRIAAKIGFSDTIGVAEGARGSLLDFRFIPQGSLLELNDLVQTSGIEDGIPANLVIGLITEVKENDTEPFKAATIEPLVDLRSYQTVAVTVPIL
ncbi:MAG: rod shape-determining protein MreC [bacterium]|nr:rod shape-determining protein MreC [bacterium]